MADIVEASRQLSRAEDHELRRLDGLQRLGVVAGRLAARFDELRSRDRREKIRPPADDTVAAPSRR
jgi:hypothetical protein